MTAIRLPWLLVIGATMVPGIASAQSTVLWYHGNGGTTTDSQAFDDHVTGVLLGDVAFEDDWAALVWSDYRFVILARPTTTLDSAQIADLDAYLTGGGLVVVAGDSLSAGVGQIDTINLVMTDLGRSMRLEEETFTNPNDPNTSAPACNVGSVVNAGPLVAASNPPSFQHLGDIDPGTSSILVGYSILLQSTLYSFDAIVEEDSVVLTADYHLFSGNDCGMTAKEAFWSSLFLATCDQDGDGFDGPSCGGLDCDDADITIGPPSDFADNDGDGYGDPDTLVCAGGVTQGDDCDDDDATVNPGATEVCDDVDNDCDGDVDGGLLGTFFPDDDGDGFGADDPIEACEAPDGYVEIDGDCDDTSEDVNPEAFESCPANGIDDDCDGVLDPVCDVEPPDKPCGCASAGPGPALPALLGWFAWMCARRSARR